jgi:MEMO1 family protein
MVQVLPMPRVRRPAVAGRFYAADASALRADLRALLAAAPVDAGGPAAAPKMLLVPHAGYVYSGAVAARAYAALAPWRGRIRRVVLLGPTHRVALDAIAAPTVDAFETPLGTVRLDRAALDGLADLPQVVADDRAHAAEHALEVQLPFLQTVLDDFVLVPLAVGDVAPEAVAQVIQRLWGGDETLVVISSDLSHDLPYEQARVLDAQTLQRILALDPSLTHARACGATPLAGALAVARAQGLTARALDLRNSGDTAGDRARVVGYAAVAFEPAPPRADDPESHADANDRDLGDALTCRARNAIAADLGLATRPEPPHAALARPGASFVTLRCDGALRGCIGTLQAQRSLDDDVRHNARAAAFRDPRFDPLAAYELAALQIAVSLIGRPVPLAVASEREALDRLRPGLDGVLLEWCGRDVAPPPSALPQVWAQLPQPAAFLAELRRKAGLSPGFWAEDLALSRYRVREFHEGAAA